MNSKKPESVIVIILLLSSVGYGNFLTPNGTVSLDCGSQQTFTCSVTDTSPEWTITGLREISVTTDSGLSAADNPRITTTDISGIALSSTITITGFTTSDDGGTIQCIAKTINATIITMVNISVGIPFCPEYVTPARNNDYTSATVTWQQIAAAPVTSTTVTYCPTSSPNCGDSMNCTSPCTISGLDPCAEYQFTVIPNNNCGSPTGCTGNNMITASKGFPSCPTIVDLVQSSPPNNVDFDGCDVSLTWQQPPNTPPVTSTTVTYCPKSSPNCGNSMTCTSPCTISGLLNDTEYNFKVIPNNNCGSATGCTGNTVTHQICPTSATPTTDSKPPPPVSLGLIIGVVVAVVLLALIIAIIATILICRFCLAVKCCKSGSDAKNKPPREEQPRGDYADPQTVRDTKEMTEENGITYAALQFSEEAGGNGKNDVHCKEELGNVQYSEVERLQV